MRLFVALDIDEGIRGKILQFMEDVRGFAPDVRWVRPESLHVTLKFIGERSDADAIKQALSQIQVKPFEMAFHGLGFFPTQKSARVFWIGIQSAALPSLARAVDEAVISLGITKEAHVFSPHLTLARSGSGRPSNKPGDRPTRNFKDLQAKLAVLPVPKFDTITAREFFLYQSQLSPKGSHYTKLAAFTLH
jgi:2'-5' RNA ligase